jgi:hypothetical protein
LHPEDGHVAQFYTPEYVHVAQFYIPADGHVAQFYIPEDCQMTQFYTPEYVHMAQFMMIYLLTASGLPPGGSCTIHIYTQAIHRTTQNKQYIEQHKI